MAVSLVRREADILTRQHFGARPEGTCRRRRAGTPAGQSAMWCGMRSRATCCTNGADLRIVADAAWPYRYLDHADLHPCGRGAPGKAWWRDLHPAGRKKEVASRFCHLDFCALLPWKEPFSPPAACFARNLAKQARFAAVGSARLKSLKMRAFFHANRKSASPETAFVLILLLMPDHMRSLSRFSKKPVAELDSKVDETARAGGDRQRTIGEEISRIGRTGRPAQGAERSLRQSDAVAGRTLVGAGNPQRPAFDRFPSTRLITEFTPPRRRTANSVRTKR